MRFKTFEEIKRMTNTEKDMYALEVFNHYRTVGFPHFRFPDGYKFKVLNKMKKADLSKEWTIDENGDVFTSFYHLGYDVANSFMPHMQETRTHTTVSLYSHNSSPMDNFVDDKKLLTQIRKIMKVQEVNDNTVRNFLKYGLNAKRVSNFKPMAAMAIWDKYLVPGTDIVWDPSMGYGGRLLALLATSRIKKYIGTDPATKSFKCLVEMNRFFDGEPGTFTCTQPPIFEGKRTKLINCGSEDVMDYMDASDIGKVGCVFTSPPYFAQEIYSHEETQSWKRFPTPSEWMNGYMRQTLLNARHILVKDGYIIINIDNVLTYKTLVDDMIAMAAKSETDGGCGLELREIIYLKLGTISHLNMSKIKKRLSEQGADATNFGMKPGGLFKRERIFIFQRKEDKHWVKHESKKTLF